MESFFFSKDARIIGGVILVILLIYLYFRKSSSSAARTDFTKPVCTADSVVRLPEKKSEYTDELSQATLYIDGGKVEVNFNYISNVDVDKSFPEIALEQKTGKVKYISLGAYDLLVSKGEPEVCEVRNACQIRVWAREKLIYDESLAGVELGDGYITGYAYDGSDVCLIFGPELTVCSEEV